MDNETILSAEQIKLLKKIQRGYQPNLNADYRALNNMHFVKEVQSNIRSDGEGGILCNIAKIEITPEGLVYLEQKHEQRVTRLINAINFIISIVSLIVSLLQLWI